MKRRLLLITLALVLLVVGMNLIVRGAYISGRVQAYVVSEARKSLGYEVGMEKVVVNFFPAYVDLDKPYMKGWDKDAPGRTLRADRVRAYFNLGAFISRDLQIRRVQVYRPTAEVVKLGDGAYNISPLIDRLKALSKEKGGPGAVKAELDEVVLFGANISYTDPAERLSVMLGDAGVDFRIKGSGRYWFGYNLKDVLVRRGDMPPIRASFDGDTLWDNGKAEVQGVRLKSEGTKVSLAGTVQWSKAPVLDLKMDADVELAVLDRLALWKGGPTGNAYIKGRVKGAYPDLSGDGTLAFKKVTLAGVPVDDLQSDVKFEKGELSVPKIKSSFLGGEVAGSLAVDFGGESVGYRSSWIFKNLISGRYTEVNKGLNFIPWHRVSGKVDISGRGFSASGVVAKGVVDLARYDTPHRSPGLSAELDILKSVHAGFDIRDKVITVSDGSVATRGAVVNFAGTVGFDGESNLSVKGRSSDIGEISTLIGYSDIKGYLDFTGRMEGNIAEPVIAGKGRITGAVAHGVPFQSGYGDVRLAGWQLSFKDFLINQDKGSLLVNGRILFKGEGATFDNPRFQAKLGVRNVGARKVISIFYEDIPVNLTADGELSFDGDLNRFKGEGHLTTGGGDVYGQKVDKGEVSAVLTEKAISFPKVIAVRDRDILTASGSIGFDGTFTAKASSARVGMGNVNILTDTGLPVSGSMSVSVTGGGSFDHPDIYASAKAYKLYYKDVDLGEGSLTARIRGGVLTGSGDILQDKVTFDGFLELAAPSRWRGRLTFNEGHFEPFLRALYRKLPDGVSLISTGVFTAEGVVDDPSKTAMSLSFSKVSASIMGRQLENVGDVRLVYDRGRLDIKSFTLRGEDTGFEVSGGAESLEKANIKVKAQTDLAAFKEFVEGGVDFLDGKAKGELDVRGSLKDPSIYGRVNVTGAGIKFKDFPQRFDGINAVVDFDSGGFKLTELTSVLGGGKVTARGSGNMKGLSVDSFTFNINAADVKVKYPENLTSIVDAKVLFEGAGRQKTISGEVVVKKARYTERIEWKSWLLQLQKKRKEVASGSPAQMEDIALNVHVTGKQGIRIDNNVAKLSVTPDLYLRGTLARPVLLGRFEAAGGQVYFRNNEFKLLSGAVEFADPNKLNPVIDLQGETRVREYLIQLTVSGTLDRLKVNLLSDPPLEDVDIITLLTVGRTSEGLKGREAAITTGEAAGFVTGQIQDAVEERVRKITGFDRFQIDPYLTSTGASSGPRLTVGKSLFSDKLYITFSSNVGTSEDQFVRVEYVFNKNLSVVGERDELGHVGGDLKFRFEFK